MASAVYIKTTKGFAFSATVDYQSEVQAFSRLQGSCVALERYCGSYLLELWIAGKVIFSLNLNTDDQEQALAILHSLKY